jgi:hypothetical protein
MITLLSPVYRQSVREAPYQVKGRSSHAGRGTVRKLFLLDRILIEAPNVFRLVARMNVAISSGALQDPGCRYAYPGYRNDFAAYSDGESDETNVDKV